MIPCRLFRRMSRFTSKQLMSCLVLTLVIFLVYRLQVDLKGKSLDTDREDIQRHFRFRPNETVHHVLLVGYPMGGTAFPGEVLGLQAGNFYVHEPLHKMARFQYLKPGFICNSVDTDCNSTQILDVEALGIVMAIYRCDDVMYRGQLLTWQVLKTAGGRDNWRKVVGELCVEEKDCRGKILHQCHVSVARVVNVVRLSLSLAARLLERIPKLKIIHVLRDPRAIINTHIQSKRSFRYGVSNYSRSLCRRMMEDIEESKRIHTNFPGKLLTVLHESLALTPLYVIREMRNFGGHTFDDANGIMEKTRSIFGGNSSLSAGSWRTQLPWSVTKATNMVCSGVYRALGYPRIMNRDEQYNTSIPLLKRMDSNIV